ncbi:MAG TPA: DinB family protein [Thermomicrobiales bacterium]|nr:DinB family protein [Thermomicrobiales bacterium]
MAAFGQAYSAILHELVESLLNTLRDIPDDVLNTWKPAAAGAGSHKMNTFAAIAIHTVSAGEFMTLHAVRGQPMDRDREAEFLATASFPTIEERFTRWLTAVDALVIDMTDTDLGGEPKTDRYQDRQWRNGAVLLHAVDHTALHLGHVQVQRQLWEHETSHQRV